MTNYILNYTDEFMDAPEKAFGPNPTQPADDDLQSILWEGSPSVLPDYLLEDPETSLEEFPEGFIAQLKRELEVAFGDAASEADADFTPDEAEFTPDEVDFFPDEADFIPSVADMDFVVPADSDYDSPSAVTAHVPKNIAPEDFDMDAFADAEFGADVFGAAPESAATDRANLNFAAPVAAPGNTATSDANYPAAAVLCYFAAGDPAFTSTTARTDINRTPKDFPTGFLTATAPDAATAFNAAVAPGAAPAATACPPPQDFSAAQSNAGFAGVQLSDAQAASLGGIVVNSVALGGNASPPPRPAAPTGHGLVGWRSARPGPAASKSATTMAAGGNLAQSRNANWWEYVLPAQCLPGAPSRVAADFRSTNNVCPVAADQPPSASSPLSDYGWQTNAAQHHTASRTMPAVPSAGARPPVAPPVPPAGVKTTVPCANALPPASASRYAPPAMDFAALQANPSPASRRMFSPDDYRARQVTPASAPAPRPLSPAANSSALQLTPASPPAPHLPAADSPAPHAPLVPAFQPLPLAVDVPAQQITQASTSGHMPQSDASPVPQVTPTPAPTPKHPPLTGTSPALHPAPSLTPASTSASTPTPTPRRLPPALRQAGANYHAAPCPPPLDLNVAVCVRGLSLEEAIAAVGSAVRAKRNEFEAVRADFPEFCENGCRWRFVGYRAGLMLYRAEVAPDRPWTAASPDESSPAAPDADSPSVPHADSQTAPSANPPAAPSTGFPVASSSASSAASPNAPSKASLAAPLPGAFAAVPFVASSGAVPVTPPGR